MGFEKGSISFRMFFPSKELTEDMVEQFATHALPPLTSLAQEEMSGWVGHRHPLDRKITEENAYLGGYMRLGLTQAEKKVPASLMAAECALEEMVVMETEDRPFLDAKTRSEIKNNIKERLLPDMPAQLKSIDFVYDARSQIIYSSATSEKQLDAFVLTLLQTTGVSAEAAEPEIIAGNRLPISATKGLKATRKALPDRPELPLSLAQV